MFDIEEPSEEVKRTENTVQNDFVWGAGPIGAVIGRTGRQTHHMLTSGHIKSAKQFGNRWVASRRALLREFGA